MRSLPNISAPMAAAGREISRPLRRDAGGRERCFLNVPTTVTSTNATAPLAEKALEIGACLGVAVAVRAVDRLR
jgi:hypothetical protein